MPAALAIHVAWRLRHDWGARPLLARVARLALRAQGFRRGQLSVAVVGARAMTTLHRRYLGLATPTDVLTFDLGGDVDAGRVEGEIVICADVARRCARPATRAGARAELALYVVHGILHLAGYDDHAATAARAMHAREDALLRRCGLGAVFSRGQS
jgi:probable rRNA maturation factor